MSSQKGSSKKRTRGTVSSNAPSTVKSGRVTKKAKVIVNDDLNKDAVLNPNKSAARIAEELAGEGEPVRVYADGIYDLFHYGHARSLEQAKKVFPNVYLLVGVCDDELTNKMKGRTVMTEDQRAESIRHCRWVDEVIEHAPWVVTKEYLEKHKIDYVVHGQDLSLDENGNDVYAELKKAGMYRNIRRTEGVSTSDIILKIVKDYDSYVKRNLKRGYTAEEMNVSFLKKSQLQIQDKLEGIRDESRSLLDKFMRGFNQQYEEVLSKVSQLRSPPMSPERSNEYDDEDDDDNNNNDSLNDDDNDDDVAASI